MDMSPFANNNQQQPSMTPDYLKQSKGGGAPGVVSNMVKAIMDGNNKFQQRGSGIGGMFSGMGGTPGGAVPGATGPTSFGGTAGPMPLATPSPSPNAAVNAGSMAPPPAPPVSAPLAPQNTSMVGNASPFQDGARAVPFGAAPGIMSNGAGSGFPGMPNGPDRSMMGLFSQIPGGMYGG